MDLATYIQNAVKAKRAEEFAQSDQLTLGELISKCELCLERHKGEGEDIKVQYDFEYLYPTKIDSWRGSYDELALNFVDSGRMQSDDQLNLLQFIELLKSAVGATFYGYKGGDFLMSRQTPIWVANYGCSGNTAVIDVIYDYSLIIITGYRKF